MKHTVLSTNFADSQSVVELQWQMVFDLESSSILQHLSPSILWWWIGKNGSAFDGLVLFLRHYPTQSKQTNDLRKSVQCYEQPSKLKWDNLDKILFRIFSFVLEQCKLYSLISALIQSLFWSNYHRWVEEQVKWPLNVRQHGRIGRWNSE